MSLIQVPPGSSKAYVGHGSVCDSELLLKGDTFNACGSSSSNFPHLVFRKFRQYSLSTPSRPAFLGHIFQVVCASPQKQMFNIATRSIIASVADKQTALNRTVGHLPSQPMGLVLATSPSRIPVPSNFSSSKFQASAPGGLESRKPLLFRQTDIRHVSSVRLDDGKSK